MGWPHGAYVVAESSWLRRLERMNAVHRGHDPEAFLRHRKHFVLSFHDSTFECIANGYRVMLGSGPIIDMVSVMRGLLANRWNREDFVVPALPSAC